MEKQAQIREVLGSWSLPDQLWEGREKEDRETSPSSGGGTWRGDGASLT